MYLPRSLISHLYTQLVRTFQPLSSPVLILSSLDSDAICACRIFAALLKRDYIPHKIQPVAGYEDLAKAGETLVRPMKTTEGGTGGVVICLGVGGLVDLSSMLGLDSEDPTESMGGVDVWLLDARRPWNLHNVFGGQPPVVPLQETDANIRRKLPGVDKGCLQRSYRPGKGGVIVFDDGDIADELDAERDAYCALIEMPEVEDNGDDDDQEDEEDEENEQDTTGRSKKRKSWSDNDEDDSNDEDEERPRQRRRSNSGSSIASPNRTPPSSQPSSPPPAPREPTAKQLRKKLLALRRSHESVLEKYYSIGNSYSEPISSLAYSLASELGREDNDMLWLAIVGVTSLELSGHTSTGLGTSRPKANHLPSDYHKSWKATRSSRTYALLRDEVRRLNPPRLEDGSLLLGSGSPTSPSDNSIRLSPDPRFLLLRHWSLYDSMLHSPYLAARLHVWKDDGVKRLHKLLAKMGVSLTQCKQTYTHMDMDLKKMLRERLLQYAGVYGLDDIVPSGNGHATYEQEGWGFIRSWGWKAQLSAIDVGVILGAILDVGNSGHAAGSSTNTYNGSSQATDKTLDVADRSEVLIPRFFAAYDALGPNHSAHLIASIPTAQHLLRAINRTGSSLMGKRQLRHLRAFRLAVVKDGPDLALFANSPGALVKLALWLSESIEVSESHKRGAGEATPLVLAALDELRNTYLIVGTGGGIGSVTDTEAKKEKAEAREKRRTEKEEKRRKKQEEREKQREIRRAALGEDADDEEEDEETESESDDSSDGEDEEDEEQQKQQKARGYGHNRFGIAFQEVVEETSARVKIDSFDHCVVEVQKEDLQGFLEGLSFKSVIGR